MKVFFIILGFLAFLVISSLWSGYVLSVLWNWFIAPGLHVPQISIAIAIGLSLVVHMLTYQSQDGQKKGSDWVTPVVVALISPLISLILGYIVHLFV